MEQRPNDNGRSELADMIENATHPNFLHDILLDRGDRELIIAALRATQLAAPAQSDAFNSAGWRVKHPHGYWYITQDKALVETYRDEHKMDVHEVFVRAKNAQSEAGK